MGQTGHKIRRRRRYHNLIGPLGQLDVPHASLGFRVKQRGAHRFAAQSLIGQRRNKCLRPPGHDNPDFVPRFFQ